jgi:ElaB/YqjD/DUF883 family membrane-anchored ribosome-binding protein
MPKPNLAASDAVADSDSLRFQQLIEIAQDLLESLHDLKGAAARRLRAKLSATIESARESLSDAEGATSATGEDDETDADGRRSPWGAAALGVLAALIGLGVLVVASNE